MSSRALESSVRKSNSLCVAVGITRAISQAEGDIQRKEKVQRKQKRRVGRGGRLKDKLISPLTQTRYTVAVRVMLGFWSCMGLKPEGLEAMDDACASFVEACWAEGDSITLVCQALAGLQWLVPKVRHKIPYAWSLAKAWAKAEPPNRATPFSPSIVLGLAGLCFEVGMISMAALLLVGFDGFLRSGELFSMKVGDISFRRKMAIIKLAVTKGGQRRGLMEVIVITSSLAVKMLRLACKGKSRDDLVADGNGYYLRNLLRSLISSVGLPAARYSWYSLRRGGATAYFLRTGSMEKTLLRGRWMSTSIARLYIQDAVALANELMLSDASVRVLRGFALKLQ